MTKTADTKKHTFTVEITEDDLQSLLVTAVEGGDATQWAVFQKYNPDKGLVMVAEHNESLNTNEWGDWHLVSADTLLLGLQRAAAAGQNEGGWAFGAFMRDRIGDASVADVLLQFTVLGSVVYG